MRPDISDDLVKRFREYLFKKHGSKRAGNAFGRGYGGITFDEALDELLKEVGY